MAFHRTIDHDEIRAWVERNGAHPALIAGTTTDDSSGDLTIAFGSSPDTVPIGWQEFFGMFESRNLRFRYDEPREGGRDADWSFGFEDRSEPLDGKSDETQLPEDADDVEENMFPSAP